jgi:hypothetical protein
MFARSSTKFSLLFASILTSSAFADHIKEFQAAGVNYVVNVKDQSLNFAFKDSPNSPLSTLNFISNPAIIGTFDRSGLTYMMIKDNHQNLEIFDLTDPCFPTFVSSMSLQDAHSHLKTFHDGNQSYGLLYGGDKGLLNIVDLSTPHEPKTLSTTQTVKSADNLAVFSDGNRLYLGVAQSSLQTLAIYDMTNPQVLLPIRQLNVPLTQDELNLTFNNQTRLVEIIDQEKNVRSSFPIFLSNSLGTFKSNPGVSSNLLNQINNQCNQDTQTIITNLLNESQNAQYKALTGLTPSYKVIQYSLEKLSFAIQKDMQDILYNSEKFRRLYGIVGYDYLRQTGDLNQTGYSTNSAYQFFGVRSGYEKFRWQIGGGASESFMNLSPLKGHASFYTLYGTAGLSANASRWEFGINGLYGYTFINGKRTVPYISQTAKNSHGAYNLNFEGMLSWHYVNGKYRFSPYETLGYLFGSENNYHEEHASGANMKVKSEKIHALRNSLGGSIDIFQDRWYQLFVDLAWVYEHYFHNKSYKAAFIGTDVYGTYRQITPTSDYVRAKIGARGHCGKLDWQAMSLTLVGSHFIEETISLNLTYKY